MNEAALKVEKRLAQLGPKTVFNWSWIASRCRFSKSNLSKWRNSHVIKLGADKAARIVRLLNGTIDPEDGAALIPPSGDLILSMVDFGYSDVFAGPATIEIQSTP